MSRPFSLLVDRDRDLVAAPERDGPRRVVQPRGGLADGLESDSAQRLEELFGARGDGVGARSPVNRRTATDSAGRVIRRTRSSSGVGRLSMVHFAGMTKRMIQPSSPPSDWATGAVIAIFWLVRWPPARRPVRSSRSAVLVVAPEDIAGQSAKPRTARRLFVGGDGGFGGDTWAVTADFHPVDERPGGVSGLFGSNADARHRQRLDELTHHSSDLAQHAAILSARWFGKMTCRHRSQRPVDSRSERRRHR